jgi:hypothetical protein
MGRDRQEQNGEGGKDPDRVLHGFLPRQGEANSALPNSMEY